MQSATHAAATGVRHAPSAFDEFAEQWLLRHQLEGGRTGRGLAAKSAEDLEWRVRRHLIPFFKAKSLADIRVADVDAYRLTKIEEGRLSPSSINKTLSTLAAILDLARDYELIEQNPASGARRRLRTMRSQRVWLDRADHIRALVDAAGELDRSAAGDPRLRRLLIATLTFAGLRIGEALAVRWSDIDLDRALIHVRDAKTAAGVRSVNILPVLLRALSEHRGNGLVLSTRTGGPLAASNVRKRMLAPSVCLANKKLAAGGHDPLPAGLTPHALRRTFASLLFAIGESPPYVMAQLGHTSANLTLTVYARQMDRRDGEPERLRALVAGADTGDSHRVELRAATEPS
jgi:integrase